MAVPRIISGIQPSGALHLGNYFGALQRFVALQDEGEAFYFVADWHALTTVHDGATLAANARDVVLDYLALGVDPSKSAVFLQSQIPEHQALAWILASVAPMALLERAHSYKDKIARGVAPSVALFTYPVLMAADILLYNADQVPVGQDQKQHLEIARDLAHKFNARFVADYNPNAPSEVRDQTAILRPPEALILAERASVPGTDGQKMSKSYGNTLELFLEEKPARQKIMRIPTDSTPIEAPKPPDAPLLQYLKLLAPADEAREHEASWQAGGVGYGTYKKRLVELYLAYFADARRRRSMLAQDPQQLDDILRRGAERARDAAAPTWQAITKATGCAQLP